MNKLISANYWFGCDWWLCEVGYLGMRADQLSLACAGVYLWNTGHLRVTDPRMCSGFQQVYNKIDENLPDPAFLSNSNQKHGYWVGFAEDKRDQLRWKILTEDTNKVITRSAVRSTSTPHPIRDWHHCMGRFKMISILRLSFIIPTTVNTGS